MIVVLRAAGKALKQWQDLPAEERERLRKEAGRVKRLALELGGPTAERLVGRRAADDLAPPKARDRSLVTRELHEAIQVLAQAGGRGVASVAMGSSRTVRLGSRLALSGRRRARDSRDADRGHHEPSQPGDEADQTEVGP